MERILPFLVYMLTLRNAGGLEHSDDVATWSVRIGRRASLTKYELKELEYAARVHDIGKLAIPDAIINKPARLTQSDLISIRQHPTFGAEMLKLLDIVCGKERMIDDNIIQMVKYHHENHDGSGYPDGLKGEQIPLGARIIRLADSFCAMTTQYRIYKAVLKPAAALRLIQDTSNNYDPDLLKIFVEVYHEQ